MTLLLTHAKRSTVTHVDVGGWTVCGRKIEDNWAGQYDEGIPRGIPSCQRCLKLSADALAGDYLDPQTGEVTSDANEAAQHAAAAALVADDGVTSAARAAGHIDDDECATADGQIFRTRLSDGGEVVRADSFRPGDVVDWSHTGPRTVESVRHEGDSVVIAWCEGGWDTRSADAGTSIERVTRADVVTREWVQDRDTYTLMVNGEIVGRVDSTRDWTGDRTAWLASGEIVAPRFNGTREAEQYLTSGVRPVMCSRQFGGYGGCIRQDGHYEQCADAHGRRFDGKRRPTYAEWTLALDMSADIEAAQKAKRVDIAEIAFLLNGNPWDADAVRQQSHAADVRYTRDRRGQALASARRFVRDARFLRLNGGTAGQVHEALYFARAWRILGAAASLELSVQS